MNHTHITPEFIRLLEAALELYVAEAPRQHFLAWLRDRVGQALIYDSHIPDPAPEKEEK